MLDEVLVDPAPMHRPRGLEGLEALGSDRHEGHAAIL
jgi:hypothetical protein